METIIELLIFAALAIILIIVWRKAKELKKQLVICNNANKNLLAHDQAQQNRLKQYERELYEQREQIAEKDVKIKELDKMLGEPSFYAYDVRAILDTVYLECYNNHTKQSFTKYLGAVTNERQRKEMVTRLHKLVKGQYHISAQG